MSIKRFGVGCYFFLLPYLALALVLPLDGMARNIYFIYVDTQEHAIIMPGSVFILPPYTRENAGIEPGSQAPQASTLSIGVGCYNLPQQQRW